MIPVPCTALSHVSPSLQQGESTNVALHVALVGHNVFSLSLLFTLAVEEHMKWLALATIHRIIHPRWTSRLFHTVFDTAAHNPQAWTADR